MRRPDVDSRGSRLDADRIMHQHDSIRHPTLPRRSAGLSRLCQYSNRLYGTLTLFRGHVPNSRSSSLAATVPRFIISSGGQFNQSGASVADIETQDLCATSDPEEWHSSVWRRAEGMMLGQRVLQYHRQIEWGGATVGTRQRSVCTSLRMRMRSR